MSYLFFRTMISTIFIIIAAICILLLPVAFWMYIFVSFFPYGVSRRQFVIGMLSWAIITLPLVYTGGFFSENLLRDTFLHLSLLWETSSSIYLFLSLTLFFWFLSLSVFLITLFFQKKKKIYLRSYVLFFPFLLVLLFLWVQGILFFSQALPYSISGVSVMFWDILFVSVGSIISYYIVISFLEEWSKYISSLSLSWNEGYFQIFQKYICMAACIALGFSFFENLLYTYSYITSSGIEYQLLSIIFFRSVFSIILHIISSMLFAFGFWFIFRLKRKYIQNVISFFLVASLWIISHVFFDTFLSFGYVGYIFFYIIAIYFFLSYVSMSFASE